MFYKYNKFKLLSSLQGQELFQYHSILIIKLQLLGNNIHLKNMFFLSLTSSHKTSSENILLYNIQPIRFSYFSKSITSLFGFYLQN